MPVTEIGDPRLQALFGANDPRDTGVRPTVCLPSKGLPPLALGIVAVVLAALLFTVLNSRRTSQAEPTVRTRPDSEASAWNAPPPLYLPVEAPVVAPPETSAEPQQRPSAQIIAAPVSRSAPPQIIYAPQPMPQMSMPAPIAPARASAGAPLVLDTGGAATGASAAPSSVSQFTGQGAGRMRASALANRSTTVPQGYLIPAVLETGFDSTKPGFARAVVSRDVRGFDGKNILIPRGSRLIGEYRSDVAQGQKRAIIIWSRLIRPDGMTIAMDSPAVDTVGRGGIAASVNTHFFQRLGDALLQTTVQLGSAFASRAVTGPVVVLPGNAAAPVTQVVPSNSYVPTLTVPPGKSISIFVAHDLDFSSAEAVR
jgi:type IV secretion system protein VirB10